MAVKQREQRKKIQELLKDHTEEIETIKAEHETAMEGMFPFFFSSFFGVFV
jgi:hypothetical protein